MTKVAKSFNNISIPMNNPLSRYGSPDKPRGEWNTELGFVVKVNIQCSSNIVFNSLVIRIKCPLNIVLNGQVL